MNGRQSDSKTLARVLAIGIAALFVVVMVVWGMTVILQTQAIEDPTQRAIEEQGLL